MTYAVYLVTSPTYDDHKSVVSSSARAALEHQNASPGEVTIVLTDEEHIRQLNKQYAGVDAPTDVLGFSHGMQNPETGVLYYGDVIIALPIAESQAREAGHSLEAELSLLTVHGVLHLLGHEDVENSERDSMLRAQREILDRLGIDPQSLEAA